MNLLSLEKLGLQKAEIEVYLALLKNNLLTANKISKYTGLNRSHIYDKIEILLRKGLVSFVIKNNIKYFKAAEPEKLLDYVGEMQKEIQDLMPFLNKVKHSDDKKTIVELYQGKEGMKTVFKDILKEKQDYLVFGEEGKFQEILPEFIGQLLRDVNYFKIKEYVLSKESKRGKISTTEKNTQIRYLPDNYFSPVMMVTYADKLAIFIWSDPLFAILIKNQDVSISFKFYFELLWKIAKK